MCWTHSFPTHLKWVPLPDCAGLACKQCMRDLLREQKVCLGHSFQKLYSERNPSQSLYPTRAKANRHAHLTSVFLGTTWTGTCRTLCPSQSLSVLSPFCSLPSCLLHSLPGSLPEIDLAQNIFWLCNFYINRPTFLLNLLLALKELSHYIIRRGTECATVK